MVLPIIAWAMSLNTLAPKLAVLALVAVAVALLAPFLIRCRTCGTSLATTLFTWRYGSGDGFWDLRWWALPHPPVCSNCGTSLWQA
jgi:hypothetical protein